MFEDSPEKRPATPIMITMNHFCLLLKIWNGCSERGRCSTSRTPACVPGLSVGRSDSASASSWSSSGEMKGLARDREENLLRLLGAWENVRLCSSALEILVLIDSLSSNRPHSGSNREFRFDSNATDEMVDPAGTNTPRPTSRHPSRVVNRRRSMGTSSGVFMIDVRKCYFGASRKMNVSLPSGTLTMTFAGLRSRSVSRTMGSTRLCPR